MTVVPGRPPDLDRDADLTGRRVTVMGLGSFSGGIETVRWLAARGAEVLVTDLKEEAGLAESLRRIAGLPVRTVLGTHREEDFTGADLVVASPAVPPESRFLALAADAGVPLATELTLTMALLPGPVAWVTGTCGKSTTTALLGEMLRAGGVPCRVGGNIGRALLPEAAEVPPGEVAVIEVSSFQLEWMARDGIRPDLAVVTNVTPNHLDRHGSFERYLEAKAAVLPERGPAVLNRDDRACREDLGPRVGDRAVWTSTADPRGPGGVLAGDRAVLLVGEREEPLFSVGDLRLLGDFNRANALQAAVAARLLGARSDGASEALRGFRGLPHRLEDLGVRGRVRGVNDSKATTPEAAVRAIRAIMGGIVLVAGGFERGADLGGLAEEVGGGRVRAVVLLGESAERLAEALGGTGAELLRAGTIEEAVEVGRSRAREGDTLLLSPGHASWDMFGSYEERGDRFRRRFLAAERPP